MQRTWRVEECSLMRSKQESNEIVRLKWRRLESWEYLKKGYQFVAEAASDSRSENVNG
jgi:hypothetical protein